MIESTGRGAQLALYQAIMSEVQTFCQEKKLAPSTMKKKCGIFDRLWRGLKDWSASAITEWLEAYLSPRTGKPLGPHGQNNYIIQIRWYFRRTQIPCLAVHTEEILKTLRRKKAPITGQYVEASIFDLILEHSPSTTHDLAFTLIKDCAFRPHELLSIRVKDLSWYARDEESPEFIMIHLPESNPVTSSKRNKTGERTIFVQDNIEQLTALAEARLEAEGEEARLFPWAAQTLSVTYCRMKTATLTALLADKTPAQAFQVLQALKNPAASQRSKHVQKKRQSFGKSREDLQQSDSAWLQKCKGLFGRLYDLRHTAITDLYRHEYPDQVIRKMVGWLPFSNMPDVYVHITDEHIYEQLIQDKSQQQGPENPDLPLHLLDKEEENWLPRSNSRHGFSPGT